VGGAGRTESCRVGAAVEEEVIRAWGLVEWRIGRAGALRQRTARRRQWDRKYGEGKGEVGHVIGGRFVPQEEARESAFCRGYADHFAAHPGGLEELIGLAGRLRDPHAEATGSVGLQVPAILSWRASSAHDRI
jgi:hypothetical protein